MPLKYLNLKICPDAVIYIYSRLREIAGPPVLTGRFPFGPAGLTRMSVLVTGKREMNANKSFFFSKLKF